MKSELATEDEVCAVPVLPATFTPRTRAPVPDPPSTTASIPSFTWEAVCEETAWPRALDCVVEVVAPSGERM